MRIVVNNIAASSGGAMTVLQDFYRTVRENDAENEWIFLLGDNYIEETDNIRVVTLPDVKKSALKRLLFDLFYGKNFISELEPDIVFSMQNTITFGLKIPQVVYMHQSIPFQDIKKFSFFKPSERNLAVIQHLLGRLICASVRRASKVIVQTDWIKNAVIEKCRVSADRVIKIFPPNKDISRHIDSNIFDKTCFFYPTADNIYKNNDVVFAASKILDKEEIEHSVILTLPKEKSSASVECIGRLAYEDVLKQYNRSTLIFSSYIETVGLPLLEARAMGGLVLASDCPFSREALNGYENAYFFDPFNAPQLAELMKKVVSDRIERKDLIYAADALNSWLSVKQLILSVGEKSTEKARKRGVYNDDK